MKILQVHCRYRQPGGEDAAIDTEAELLQQAGHTVVRYEVENPPDALGAALQLAAAPWNLRAAGRLRRFVAGNRPDIAHVHNTWFALSPSVLRVLKDSGLPVVATLHNYRALCSNGLLFRDGHPCEDCVGTHPWHGVRHRCYNGSAIASAAVATTIQLQRWRRAWTQDSDLIIALTESGRERLVAGGLPAERLVVKAHSVADPGPRELPPSRSRVVLYVGRLTEEKGITELLVAWAAVDRKPLELLVIGEGPEAPRLRGLAVEGVRFISRCSVEEVRGWMLGARALTFPSRWYETFGLVVIEAMAAGLPIVASSTAALAGTIADAGWLARPTDTNSWSTALTRLQDDAAVDAAGAASRVIYRQEFVPAAGLDRLLAIYEEARRRHLASAQSGRRSP